jgi:hypothetical protein
MGLFALTKIVNAHELYPNEYYKHFYFNKTLCDGIELVAAIERTTKKQTAELLMKAGLSSYMGAKLTEYIKSERAAWEQNQKLKLTLFVIMLRKLAGERGMDISKFI